MQGCRLLRASVDCSWWSASRRIGSVYTRRCAAGRAPQAPLLVPPSARALATALSRADARPWLAKVTAACGDHVCDCGSAAREGGANNAVDPGRLEEGFHGRARASRGRMMSGPLPAAGRMDVHRQELRLCKRCFDICALELPKLHQQHHTRFGRAPESSLTAVIGANPKGAVSRRVDVYNRADFPPGVCRDPCLDPARNGRNLQCARCLSQLHLRVAISPPDVRYFVHALTVTC
jgi:hypothetical protein